MKEKIDRAKSGAQNAYTIPGTEVRIMSSRNHNRTYQIFISKPSTPPPPAGYPVIYLLDANSIFGTMAEAVRIQGRRPEKTGVIPAVIVGIGYETAEPFSSARHRDFTMPTAESKLPKRPDGNDWPEHGGAEEFFSFIEKDLKPEIERDYQIDRNRQMIFGHSLGGLFVLQVLLTKPDAFQTYVAGSPSIHWNKPFILEKTARFVSRLKKNNQAINLLLAAGELEQHHKSRMNDNARELYERLAVLSEQGIRAEFCEFSGEGHISVLPVLVSRALRFALHPDGPHLSIG
ncbi:ferri-bacillibactin esterase BesA [Bacillus vallismortis]|uniref:ferri-bacillibactin esterase BesA n=1 Tax=Bacillus vallismortis TaxID=72361 RepID=UPI0020909E8A|nr:ferri-bacillibactin esterase BesA [Bacillus vallismortis]MCO4849456.1 ferri-bacillibactin esterase BesA [Bacillus vallismortis]